MKTYFLLMTSHAVVALTASLAILVAGQLGGLTLWVASGVAVVAIVAVVSFVVSRQVLRSLNLLLHFVASSEPTAGVQTGIEEFNRTALQLSEQTRKLDEIAANNREQSREVQAVLTILNRRSDPSPLAHQRLREVLGGIGNSLFNVLNQTEQQTVEVAKASQAIAERLETQSKTVVKTSTYVERLYANIDRVADHVGQIKESATDTGKATSQVNEIIHQLQDGIEQIRIHAHQSEQTLRSLSDPSRQISTIVETISDLAARTDMLALNASIESIRAGEHGKGFAIVADEVRKLAEQSSQATREIAALIESVQLATQESISSIAKERSKVESELELVEQANTLLATIAQHASTSTTQTVDIVSATREQLSLTQNIVLALEQISKLAKSTRGDAESVNWTTKSLIKSHCQFNDAIDRFRRCAANAANAHDSRGQTQRIEQQVAADSEGDQPPRTSDDAEREMEEATSLVELS